MSLEQTRCRWLAYSGSPILIEELLYKPEHSLIDQSLHSRLGVETANGDGFGLGWYAPHTETPAVFHSIEPAWNDRNLREVASHVESPLFLAHSRASTGTAVQQTNCHPFRHGRWLWVHNGLVRDFHRVKRELALAVDESLYPHMEGSTDSEMLFYLALTFGLEDDPPRAVERMVGHVEEVGRRHGTEQPVQMTIGTTDGNSVWGFRYSSEGKSRTLYYSTDMRTVRELYPDRAHPGALRRDQDRGLRAAHRPARGVERGARIELQRCAGRRRRAASAPTNLFPQRWLEVFAPQSDVGEYVQSQQGRIR